VQLKKASVRLKDSQRRMWRAVIERNRALDGAFVYAVRSTRVYCRPSCPARRPSRDRVVFFGSPAAAERFGYRACLRCKPGKLVHQDDAALLQRACQTIETEASSVIDASALAAKIGIDRPRLTRLFNAYLGLSPHAYSDALRWRRFKALLRKGGNVTTALYNAGYGSSSRLYERSNAHLGMTPATYGRRGAGMTIDYTIASSVAGRVLVAATERGIAAVYLGDRDEALRDALREEFPNAAIRWNSRELSSLVRAIVKHLKGDQPHLDLPLDLRASAFQRRVWEALQRIPYGETRTYGEIARKLGRPTAARAVARACATNPASVVIPCHRVVREDGGLGGYRWGIERKQALLERERIEKKTGGRRSANLEV
jgi:AraC family transcriptional regulator of adaptative response/methylated-DNA-[protein]-cysteine methyltransferase